MDRRTQVNAKKQKLNKRLILRTLRGYARANKFVEAEKRLWLARPSPKESWALFDVLYRSWELMRANSLDGWENVAQRRLDEKVALRRILDRAVEYEFKPRKKIRLCSAEDLIIHKCVAGRGKDLSDIERVIQKWGNKLDLDYIRH